MISTTFADKPRFEVTLRFVVIWLEFASLTTPKAATPSGRPKLTPGPTPPTARGNDVRGVRGLRTLAPPDLMERKIVSKTDVPLC